MHEDTKRLERVLCRLIGYSDSRRAGQVEALRARLLAGRLRVLLVGEAKRGKSTLGNALLGRDLLPCGVTPVTAISTTVRPGSPERAEIGLIDGSRQTVPIGALADYVSEDGNPHNRRRVAEVIAYVTTALPADGFELVDTPGLGSVMEHNSERARSTFASMDAAVFVLTADPPVSASERALLKEVMELSVRCFVVLNKVDRLDAGERQEAERFTRRVLIYVAGAGVQIIGCSAREALRARLAGDEDAWQASGVADLARALRSQLDQYRHDDLHRSISGAAQRVARSLVDECTVGVAVLDGVQSQRADEIDAFAGALSDTRVVATEASSVVAGWARRLRVDLDQDATTFVRATSRKVVHEVDDRVAADSPTSPAAELEEKTRAAIGATIQKHVETWRRGWISRCETSANALTERLQQLVDERHAAVHDSARLLGVQLGASVAGVSAPEHRDVRYDFGPEAGWNEPLVSAVRHHAPAPMARRRAAARLRRESVTLTDKHVGRARSGLQTHIERVARELTSNAAASFDELAAGLEASLRRGRSMGLASQAEQDREREILIVREGELRDLLTVLGATDLTPTIDNREGCPT